MTTVYYLTVWGGQKSGFSLAACLCLMVLLQTSVQVAARAVVLSKGLTGEAVPSKHTHVAVGGIQFLTGCWTEGLGSLLTVGWKSPSSLPCLVGLPKKHPTT